MKILLLSDNQAIIGVLGLCLDKPGFELVSDFSENKESDLIIKDVADDELVDLDEFNQLKTLFLVPRARFDELSVKNKIIKPFLPTELIDFLTEYEKKIKSDDILLKSVELTQDSGEDENALNNILQDIDDLDLDVEKEKSTDDFDISDDVSLEDLAKKIEDSEHNINDDIMHELDANSEESLENLALEFGDKLNKEKENIDNSLEEKSNNNSEILDKDNKELENIDLEKLSNHLENEIKNFIPKDSLKNLKIVITFEEK